MDLYAIRSRLEYWLYVAGYTLQGHLRRLTARVVLSALLDRSPATEETAIPLSSLGGEAMVVDSWSEGRESVVALAVDGRVVHLTGDRALSLAAELARRVGEADRER